MKVLVADKFPDNYLQVLKDKGCEITYDPKLGENDLPDQIKDNVFLVVRSTKVNAAAIASGPELKVIIRAGSGYNTIDTKAAAEKGVAVANTPGKNSIAVAELAMGLILSLDRKIPDNVNDFRNKVWNKAEYSKASGLFGKTLGIIGVGNIGREVAKRANAFGMKVYGYDIVKLDNVELEYIDDMKELISKSDIISLHLPSNDKTKGMFNDVLFGLMKEGTMLINTSRPQIIDEEALIKAVNEKGLLVGIDVFNEEPEGKSGDVISKLQGVANIYVTHHIGASTQQAQDAVAEEVINIVEEYKNSGTVLNKVN